MKNLVGGCVNSTWDERLDQFAEEELVGLCGCLDSKLQNLRDKINLKKKKKKNQKALVVNSPPDNNNNNNIDQNLNMLNNVYQSNPLHHHSLSGSVVIAARIINKLFRVTTPFLKELRILVKETEAHHINLQELQFQIDKFIRVYDDNTSEKVKDFKTHEDFIRKFKPSKGGQKQTQNSARQSHPISEQRGKTATRPNCVNKQSKPKQSRQKETGRKEEARRNIQKTEVNEPPRVPENK
ncbi:hypothetical protein QYF36_003702 [Acer negundo]|nr:hypothetical protein QYF36_003702 [Acer negundo]